jgi:hypothetical protein
VYVAHIGQRRGLYGLLVGRPEGKRPLERPRRRWENNSKMDIQDVGYGVTDWIELVQERQVAGTCKCSYELSGSKKCDEFLDKLKTG